MCAGAPCFGEGLGYKTGTMWSPYLEWRRGNPAYSGNPFDLVATARFVHLASGEVRETGMFYDGGDTWKFRFAGTRPGEWIFVTSSADPDLNGLTGAVTIHPNPNVHGFITNDGNKWLLGGTNEAFVPQYVMFADPDRFSQEKIDSGIETFVRGHGFTGFHVGVQCRWFDINHTRADEIDELEPNPDPRTFEALERLITSTHAAGGAVHLWAWGDEQRTMTPAKWGKNGPVDKRLQRYIAARLGPLPGWTMGYGWDLWEWASEEDLREWHSYMQEQMGWPHFLGGRAGTNQLNQIYEGLDYSGYEQHRPDYDKYAETLEARPTKPSFSEDRFRVREGGYPHKDYDTEMTRRGLWHSTMAGGVANIWGYLIGSTDGGSQPYPNQEQIKTHFLFFEDRFKADMVRANDLTDGYCLRTLDNKNYVFYKEDASSVRVDLSESAGLLGVVAVDARQAYEEIDLGRLMPGQHVLPLPRFSDWAIAVITLAGMGDANADGRVDDDDLSILLAHWTGAGGAEGTWATGDFDGNGAISDVDLSFLLANWAGAAGTAVPEPATLGLSVLGGLALLRRRKVF